MRNALDICTKLKYFSNILCHTLRVCCFCFCFRFQFGVIHQVSQQLQTSDLRHHSSRTRLNKNMIRSVLQKSRTRLNRIRSMCSMLAPGIEQPKRHSLFTHMHVHYISDVKTKPFYNANRCSFSKNRFSNRCSKVLT